VIVIGLTGSIGMGKTETAKMFARHGAAVYDADAAVHALYAPGGDAVAPIAEAFPSAVMDGRVDRQILGDLVLGRPDALARLESIVHPLVRGAQGRFLREAEDRGAPLAVLDIPLLFETGADALVDKTVVVTAPLEIQKARVLARPGMTAQKFEAIRAKQAPESEKTARADYVIRTDRGLEAAEREVKAIVAELLGEAPVGET